MSNAEILLWQGKFRRTLVLLAGHGAIVATGVADMLLLFAIVFTTTPPSEYLRALILSIFTLQFTQLYFGQKATFYHLATVVAFSPMTVLAARLRSALGLAVMSPAVIRLRGHCQGGDPSKRGQ